VDRQREDCGKLAQRKGWTVAGLYVDNDVSASSGRVRPEYRRMLADVAAGVVNAVVVWDLDRLHRRPVELEDFITLADRHDVALASVGGDHDLSTSGGRLHARIIGSVARHEMEHKSERTRRAQLQAAQAGRWLGGARPFGWQPREDGTAVLDRREARELRSAADKILAGSSLGSIVDSLNRRGIVTTTGRQWNYTTLRQTLTRARNAGLSVYRGEIVGASAWPAILSEDVWRSVVSIVEDPTRLRSQSNRVRWLLAGLALCPCGSSVRSGQVRSNPATGTTRTVYRCRERGPGHVARAAQPVDDFIAQVVIARLSRPDAADLLAEDVRPDAEAIRRDAVTLRARLADAADSFADGRISAGQMERITARVQRQLDDVESRMVVAARANAFAGIIGARDPAAVWRGMTVEARRGVVTALMTVTLTPTGRRGNVFDPDAIEVTWKDSP